MENIDYEKLRSELMDYFGTAMTSGFGMAVIDLTKVENTSHEELLSIAKQHNIEINNNNQEIKKTLFYRPKKRWLLKL